MVGVSGAQHLNGDDLSFQAKSGRMPRSAPFFLHRIMLISFILIKLQYALCNSIKSSGCVRSTAPERRLFICSSKEQKNTTLSSKHVCKRACEGKPSNYLGIFPKRRPPPPMLGNKSQIIPYIFLRASPISSNLIQFHLNNQ